MQLKLWELYLPISLQTTLASGTPESRLRSNAKHCLSTTALVVQTSLFPQARYKAVYPQEGWKVSYTRVGTLIVATIYLQLIQNRYMFRSFTVLQFSHQHCVQAVASDVEVVGYL